MIKIQSSDNNHIFQRTKRNSKLNLPDFIKLKKKRFLFSRTFNLANIFHFLTFIVCTLKGRLSAYGFKKSKQIYYKKNWIFNPFYRQQTNVIIDTQLYYKIIKIFYTTNVKLFHIHQKRENISKCYARVSNYESGFIISAYGIYKALSEKVSMKIFEYALFELSLLKCWDR